MDTKIFAIIFFLFLEKCSGGSFTKKEDNLVVHFKEFKGCPGVEDVAIRYNKLELNYLGNDKFQMDGELECLQNTTGYMTFTMTITKCGTDGLEDSCKHIFNHEIKDICNDMKYNPGSMVAGFMKDSGLKASCPFEKGIYQMKPQTVELTPMAKKIVDNGIWTLQSKIERKEDKKVILCFYCKGEVMEKQAGGKKNNYEFKGRKQQKKSETD